MNVHEHNPLETAGLWGGGGGLSPKLNKNTSSSLGAALGRAPSNTCMHCNSVEQVSGRAHGGVVHARRGSGGPKANATDSKLAHSKMRSSNTEWPGTDRCWLPKMCNTSVGVRALPHTYT
uniref:Uncharacterized protein n=1 Tax=Eutreptiella gymnastica TaxID=73025 RepID=A0A7S4GJQ4_9EUGL